MKLKSRVLGNLSEAKLEFRLEEESLLHQLEIYTLAQHVLVLHLMSRRFELKASALPSIRRKLELMTATAARILEEVRELLNEAGGAGTRLSAAQLRRVTRRLRVRTSQSKKLASVAKKEMIGSLDEAVEKFSVSAPSAAEGPRFPPSDLLIEQVTAGIRSMQQAASRGDEYCKIALVGMAKDWEDTQRQLRWPLDSWLR